MYLVYLGFVFFLDSSADELKKCQLGLKRAMQKAMAGTAR